jgi:hypothetical protein
MMETNLRPYRLNCVCSRKAGLNGFWHACAKLLDLPGCPTILEYNPMNNLFICGELIMLDLSLNLGSAVRTSVSKIFQMPTHITELKRLLWKGQESLESNFIGETINWFYGRHRLHHHHHQQQQHQGADLSTRSVPLQDRLLLPA